MYILQYLKIDTQEGKYYKQWIRADNDFINYMLGFAGVHTLTISAVFLTLKCMVSLIDRVNQSFEYLKKLENIIGDPHQ